MSTYWDAVGRAALGLTGVATPRPRSMFEPDGPVMAFEDVEPLREEEGVEPAHAPTIVAALPEPPSAPAIGVNQVVQQPHSGNRSEDDEDRNQPAPTEPAPLAADAHQSRAVVAAPVARVEVPRPALFAVDRIELRHVDAMPVVSERIREKAPREQPAAVVATQLTDEAGDSEPSHPGEQPARASEPEPASTVPLIPEPGTGAPEPPLPSPVLEEPQPLVVEIERIEIRIESERIAAPPPPPRPAPTITPSLSDYLARVGGSRP